MSDYKLARDARKGTAEMTIEPAPKTSFTDRNLDPKDEPGDPAQRISSDTAKPGSSMSPIPNAPKQQSRGTGSTKPDPEGLTKT